VKNQLKRQCKRSDLSRDCFASSQGPVPFLCCYLYKQT